MTIPLPGVDVGTGLDSYLDVVAARGRRADAASLRHVLAPESVVVIGASRRRGTRSPLSTPKLRSSPANRATSSSSSA